MWSSGSELQQQLHGVSGWVKGSCMHPTPCSHLADANSQFYGRRRSQQVSSKQGELPDCIRRRLAAAAPFHVDMESQGGAASVTAAASRPPRPTAGWGLRPAAAPAGGSSAGAGCRAGWRAAPPGCTATACGGWTGRRHAASWGGSAGGGSPPADPCKDNQERKSSLAVKYWMGPAVVRSYSCTSSKSSCFKVLLFVFFLDHISISFTMEAEELQKASEWSLLKGTSCESSKLKQFSK